MSNESQILDALATAQGPLCDDCMTALVGWNDRQQAYLVGTRLAERSAIIRAHGVCSRCGRRKTVNGLPLDAVKTEEPHFVDIGIEDEREAHDGDIEDLNSVASLTFSLERDLHNALRRDIEQLEPGLTIADGASEGDTDAGPIDITAQDTEGSTVIIELKAGQAAAPALTQLLASMGAVAEQDKTAVRGILVAGAFHPRVVSAAKAVSNVQLRRYRCNFTFEAVE